MIYNEEDSRMFKFNKFQSNLTSSETLDRKILDILDKEDLDKGYLREVKIEFFEVIHIRDVISHNRKFP